MRRRERDAADLVARALFQSPQEGEDTPAARDERAVADAERLRAVREHLARYDALPPAPPPPPFARVLAAVERDAADGGGARGRPRRRVAAVAALAAASFVAVFLTARSLREPVPAPILAVEGVLAPEMGDGAETRVLEGRSLAVARATEVRWLRGGARALLDAGARVEDVAEDGARLAAGRAWFEVEPRTAGAPFRVGTRLGDVRVVGTAFEVDVRGDELVVGVLSGRVEARGHPVGPGQRLRGDRVDESEQAPGGFARVPRLGVEVEPGGGTVVVRFVFENPRSVPLEVPGRDSAPSTLWLSVTTPAGAVSDLPVGPEEWLPEGASGLVLAPRERRVVAVRFLRPFASAGTYRVTALLRPEGLPAVRSETVPVEVP